MKTIKPVYWAELFINILPFFKDNDSATLDTSQVAWALSSVVKKGEFCISVTTTTMTSSYPSSISPLSLPLAPSFLP